MKSSLAKIMFRIMPLTTIATAIVHPSSGVILASLLFFIPSPWSTLHQCLRRV